MTDRSQIRYFSTRAPCPWNKSGTAKLTVRTGGPCEVYLCADNSRMALSADQAWALWIAMGNALHATYGPAPDWADRQTDRDRTDGPTARPNPTDRSDDARSDRASSPTAKQGATSSAKNPAAPCHPAANNAHEVPSS
jgi:hypothetical protein